jgi:hypothetical protein
VVEWRYGARHGVTEHHRPGRDQSRQQLDQLLPATCPLRFALVTGAPESAFVRVEVRHPGKQMAALTNPVILF